MVLMAIKKTEWFREGKKIIGKCRTRGSFGRVLAWRAQSTGLEPPTLHEVW